MLVAKFNCPECDALLKPASPQPAGKKIRCPKCTCTIAVPSPEVEEVKPIEVEAEPASRRVTTRRSAARRPADLDEDEDDRPSRRRFARDEDEEEDERPARKRPTRRARDEEDEEEEERDRGRRRPKKSRQSGSGLKIALIAGAALFVVVLLCVGGYFLVTLVFTSPAQARAKVLDEATAALATVKDQASADAAKPALVRVGERLRAYHEKDMKDLEKGMKALSDNPNAIKDAIDEATRNPEKARAQAEKLEREQRPLKEAMDRLLAEARRVNKVPGGKEALDSLFNAWGDGGKVVKMGVGLLDDMEGFFGDPPGGKRPGRR